MDEKIESTIEETSKKKKGFFLQHLWDFVLLLVLSMGTASFYIARAVKAKSADSTDNLTATVYLEGKPMNIPDKSGKNRNPFILSTLSDEEEFEITGTHTTLVIGIKKNAIAVVSSNCPGQECVHEGWVSEANHPIVCAHNGIYIEITSSSSDDVVIG